jgi:carboxyl-terminal processing protease
MFDRRRLALAAALLAALFALAGCAGPREPRLTDEQRQANLESFDKTWETIRDRHFDPELGGVDWEEARERYRTRMELVRTMSGARRIMNELLEELGHSHVGIIPSEAYEDDAEGGDGSSEDGVPGIEIRVIDGRALVTKLWDGFPAASAGVRPGWEVVRVERRRVAPLLARVGREFAGRTNADAERALHVASLLRGPVGGTLSVRFLDAGDEEVELELELREPRGERFQAGLLAPHRAWIETRRLEGDVGYIAFDSFSYPTYVMPVFNEAMASYLDARGVILDLRGNQGGMGGMVGWMAGWLVSEKNVSLGTIVMRDNELRFVVVPRAETFDGPVAVLIDGLSVSAAEMLASGLQGIGRARLFGTRSAGASLPAQLERLPNGDALMYPTSRHLTPAGEPVEGVGVTPDVVVLLDREALLRGRDPALEAALAWIHGPAVAGKLDSNMNGTKPYKTQEVTR